MLPAEITALLLIYYVTFMFIFLPCYDVFYLCFLKSILCTDLFMSSAYNSEKFRFSAEFIEMRRQALDIFINRIASHPKLKQSEDLRIFLQEDEEVKAHTRIW